MITINGHQRSFGRAAEAVCLFQYRVEDRHEIARRGVDDLQYLGSGGLLFQCLARLGNEPRLFHRDDRLRGEISSSAISLSENGRTSPRLPRDHAEQRAVLAQRQ